MNMQVVCKHIVATYFAIFPEAAEALERAADEDYDVDDEDYDDDYDEDYDDEALSEGMYRAVLRRVLSMEQMELQQALLQLLFDGPEWQLDRFVRENGLEDDW